MQVARSRWQKVNRGSASGSGRSEAREPATSCAKSGSRRAIARNASAHEAPYKQLARAVSHCASRGRRAAMLAASCAHGQAQGGAMPHRQTRARQGNGGLHHRGLLRSPVCIQAGGCGGHIAHAALHNRRAKQPCNLGVMQCGEVVEETTLAGQDCTQVGFDELLSANAAGCTGGAWRRRQERVATVVHSKHGLAEHQAHWSEGARLQHAAKARTASYACAHLRACYLLFGPWWDQAALV